jgi:hypothetical protein
MRAPTWIRAAGGICDGHHPADSLANFDRASFEREALGSVASLFAPAAPKLPVPPTNLETCPFCLAVPEADRAFRGRAIVYCDADDCPARPQVTGATIQEATRLWNHSHHPGFIAREVRQ